MDSWAGFGGLPFPEGEGAAVLVGRHWGQGGQRQRPAGRSGSGPGLGGGSTVWRSPHPSCLWVQPQQMAPCRARTLAQGPSAGAGRCMHQLLLAKPPEAAASSLWTPPGQRGMSLGVCREPAPSPGGGREAGVVGDPCPHLSCPGEGGPLWLAGQREGRGGGS